MEYGCIGEKLTHSFSKEVHGVIADYNYQLKEIERPLLKEFFDSREFLAVNVTIPYKEKIIPYLDFVDDTAKKIGAVNTVVNKNGKLYGHNTDFFGLKQLILRAGISIEDKKVAVLGTGGTSKTASAVLHELGAKSILFVSRTPDVNSISYEKLYTDCCDVDVIINTTPVGTFPNTDVSAVDLQKFTKLQGVVDVVYNPLKTKLVSDALKLGIKAQGGLYMLVAQAVKASEYFLGIEYPLSTIDNAYQKILLEKRNVVLVGMPSCGKTTVGKILAKELNREFIDTDVLIEQRVGLSISEIFSKFGEKYFREIESEIISEISLLNNKVISTGGGAVLYPQNVFKLKQNGKLFFIDRKLEDLTPTGDRPLSLDKEQLAKRYAERYGIYSSCCDAKIIVNGDAESVAKLVIGEL